MPVIALTHEIGTFGWQIAAMIATHLGLDFADQDFLEGRIANRSMSEEHPAGCPHDAADGLGRSLAVDNWSLARHAEDEIRELAAYGNVVVRGWGAPSLLRDTPHVLRVRVVAPPCFRVGVLAAHHPTQSEAELLRLIDGSDTCLASNLEPVLGPEWRSGDFYHLTIGTHEVPIADAVRRIEKLIWTGFEHLQTVTRKPLRRSRRARRPEIRRIVGASSSQGTIDRSSIARAEQLLFDRQLRTPSTPQLPELR